MPLPPGLILNPATGELTGVPTVPGTYAIQLKVRDVLGSSRELTDEVIINPYTPMAWSGSLGNLMATRPATQITVARTGGLAPFTYSVFSGALPDGLALNTSTGEITGTPTTPGGYALTLRVVDSLAQVRDYVLAGTVVQNLTVDFTGETRGTVAVPYSETVDVAGGTVPYNYSLASGALPTGVVFAFGELTGTPTSPGTPSAVLRVTDALGFEADSASVGFDIAAYPTISGGLPRGMVGKAYASSGLTAAGGHTPYAWSAFGLPTGLSINAGTGEVTGTPTVAGLYEPEVAFTDVLLVQAEKDDLIVEIAAALAIGGAYSASVTRNIVYPTFFPVVSGGYLPRTFDISAGALPTGLTLNTSTGAISGTPTAQGAYTATLRVTDADGSTATMAFDVTVAGDMAITGSVPNRGTLTVAFTGDNLGRTGGTAPYSWSVASGAMPPGLTLNTSTGDITGTPTTVGDYNFAIRVTDASGGFAQSSFAVSVAAYPSLTGTLPDASNGLAYSAKFSAAGGHQPDSFDISAGALPGGLSIAAADGTISGTPNANGTFNFTVRMTDDAGNVTTRAGTITTYAAPSLSNNLDSPSEEGLAYSDGMSVAGGKAPISWDVQGTLPTGLDIDENTGLITGTITVGAVTSGSNRIFNFTVVATDALGRQATSAQSIDVKKRVAHLLNGTPALFPTRTISYSSSVSAQFGNGSYTFSVVAGALPTGLSLTGGTGVISGTATVAGTFNVTIRVTDGLGATADRAIAFTVLQPMAVSGAAPAGTVGVAYAYQPTASGGQTPYSWFHVAGDLPPGCTLNTTTGRVSGTPTANGTFNYTLRAYSNTNTDSADVAASTSIATYPVLTLSYPRATVGESYSGTASFTGGHNPKSFARVAGTLPPGLSLNASTGALTGTPSVSGAYSFTIRGTDGLGNIADRAGSINVAPAIAIPSAFASPATDGIAYSSTVGATGGYAPYTWSLVSGAIPTGLTRTNSTISGTPTTPGTYNFTLRATDADGHIQDKAFSIQVVSLAYSVSASPNPASDYAFSGGANVTVSASSTVTPAGGIAPFSYSWARIAVSGSAGDFTAVASPANKLTCSRTTSVNYVRTETWRCTVTDNAGTVRTIDVIFELEVEHDTGTGCPDVDCVLPDGRRVGDLKVGDMVECVDVPTGKRFQRAVRNISFSVQPRMRLRAESGATITQSVSTKMVLRDGREVTTPEMVGEDLLNYQGRLERVVGIETLDAGLCANVDLGDAMFFAGDADGSMFATHNLKQN